MTSQWRHHNESPAWWSELYSLQNVYFGFFACQKLIVWRHFVTYLWNDPRIMEILIHIIKLKPQSEYQGNQNGSYIDRHNLQDLEVTALQCYLKLKCIYCTSTPFSNSWQRVVYKVLVFWGTIFSFLCRKWVDFSFKFSTLPLCWVLTFGHTLYI